MQEITRLFPTCVLKTNINRAFSKAEMNAFEELGVYSQNIGNLISTCKTVLSDKRLKDIHRFCVNAVTSYSDEVMRPANSHRFYVTQSWLNKTTKNAYHHKHWHSNSILSGVFYINAKEESDRIYFANPIPEGMMQFHVREYTLENSKTWFFPVKTGDLLVFPSSLNHYVDANKEDYERISLAFNTFIKGTIGEEGQSNLLTL